MISAAEGGEEGRFTSLAECIPVVNSDEEDGNCLTRLFDEVKRKLMNE